MGDRGIHVSPLGNAMVTSDATWPLLSLVTLPVRILRALSIIPLQSVKTKTEEAFTNAVTALPFAKLNLWALVLVTWATILSSPPSEISTSVLTARV